MVGETPSAVWTSAVFPIKWLEVLLHICPWFTIPMDTEGHTKDKLLASYWNEPNYFFYVSGEWRFSLSWAFCFCTCNFVLRCERYMIISSSGNDLRRNAGMRKDRGSAWSTGSVKNSSIQLYLHFFASKRKYICNYMPGILFSDWTICILVIGVLTILLLLWGWCSECTFDFVSLKSCMNFEKRNSSYHKRSAFDLIEMEEKNLKG